MGNRDDQIDSYHKRSISMASCSKSICETINGSHTYVIQGYSLSKGMGPGRYLTSDTFNVGGYDWAIYFFPDGKNPEDNSLYVSVFIALASEGNDVRALFELTLRDQSGNNKHKVHSHFNRALESGPYSLKYRGSMWGYKRFFRRSLLESSEYLKDDCLELRCTVGIVRNRVEGPKLYRISVPPSDMGQSFKELLDDDLGCDVAFHIGEETFKAHKLIISARSPVFRAQFSGLVRHPNLDEVVLEDVEPSIFKAMLQFIYSDNLPDVQEIMRTTTSSPLEIVMQHLLAAADRFGLDRLKLLCEAKLCSEIAVETVAATLSLAEKHQCHQLKSICLKFATAKLGEVMETEGFKQLEVNCPSLIPELLDTVVSVDENPGPLSRKRSGSSIFGLDLAPDGAPAQPSDPNDGRRIRGRL